MSAVPLRVVVADDHPVVLASVCEALETHGMTIVARAGDGDAALAAIGKEQPDVAVLDVAMPGQTGIEVARRTRHESPATMVVLFTAFGEDELLSDSLDAGVSGIVLKDAPMDDVVRAIHTVVDGGRYVDGRLAGVVSTKQAVLTHRELAVLRLLADGLRNDEIGRRLFISPETVKVHISKAVRKLGATTRTQAVAEALRRGLLH